MRSRIHVEEVVEFLNELIEIDRVAIENIVLFKTPCNERLGDHPTVQVSTMREMPYAVSVGVGFLGILNGMFGADSEGRGPIEAVFDLACPVDGRGAGVGSFEKTTDQCMICGRYPTPRTLIRFQVSKNWEKEVPPTMFSCS